jgi:hypothetical protein
LPGYWRPLNGSVAEIAMDFHATRSFSESSQRNPTNDQQTLAIQNRAVREYAGRAVVGRSLCKSAMLNSRAVRRESLTKITGSSATSRARCGVAPRSLGSGAEPLGHWLPECVPWATGQPVIRRSRRIVFAPESPVVTPIARTRDSRQAGAGLRPGEVNPSRPALEMACKITDINPVLSHLSS